MTKPDEYVLAISPDDFHLHAARADQILAHRDENGQGLGEKMEYYDSKRTPLRFNPTDGDGIELARIPGADPVDEYLIVHRVGLALARIKVEICRKIVDGVAGGNPDPGLRILQAPVIYGRFDVVLAALVAAFGPIGDPDVIDGTHVDSLHNDSPHPHG